ncbi:branched-chain amino acid aminotransferase [Amantichitinum ursilacus]|uniref:Branched-chain-amino-acid aminotransferase n=1 Tax=Amantichitinum ursilacus TaxID=857265 RepID=A0A0N0GNH9_9NEIS|nr:branched-chain amino acid aminotransferase [Amantichitinum ursilacus]KPC52725.1 Branched-chain-amino-acid aminotransferase [Amantichitinum ursilacus]
MSGNVIPFDRRSGEVWLDGEFVEWQSARIHVLTHGLHYGSTVYEGERVYGGQVFKLGAHTDRLFASAETMDIKLPYPKAELENATRQLLERNQIVDGYVRPVAWRGSEMMATSARNNRIHVAIACWQWPSYFDPAARMAGITLQTAEWRRPPPSSSPFQAKASGHYMIATLSKHKAENAGFHDALMLDWRGYVAEATSANIFFARENRLYTPRPDCFLNGITRQTVIALAQEMGMEVIERHILPEEMGEFDECFLTGTAAEVTPVSRIDHYQFKPGRVCEALVAAYFALVQPAAAQGERHAG